MDGLRIENLVSRFGSASGEILFAAILGSNFELANLLLDAGVSVNAETKDGANALHILAGRLGEKGAPEFGFQLLEGDIKLDKLNKHGNTPLWALTHSVLTNAGRSAKGEEFVVEVARRKISLNVPNKVGRTTRWAIDQRGFPALKEVIK